MASSEASGPATGMKVSGSEPRSPPSLTRPGPSSQSPGGTRQVVLKPRTAASFAAQRQTGPLPTTSTLLPGLMTVAEWAIRTAIIVDEQRRAAQPHQHR